ncbi:MAG TPA: sensor histidine kinase [Dokdonella sp.]
MHADPRPTPPPLHEQLSALLREHRVLIEQLRQRQDHFRRVARSVWRVQEDERRRIAHELHDGIGHNVTALIHLIGEALAALPDGDATRAVRHGLERAGAIAAATLDDTRTLSRLLRPQILDDLGLEPALRWLVRTFAETHALEVALHVDGPADELDGDRRTLVFRVAQEALANVARHAQARRVEVALVCADGHASLSVRDDGRGADPRRALARSGEGASSGLGGMHERVRLFGGSLHVESEAGAGFAVTVRFPISDGEPVPR